MYNLQMKNQTHEKDKLYYQASKEKKVRVYSNIKSIKCCDKPLSLNRRVRGNIKY